MILRILSSLLIPGLIVYISVIRHGNTSIPSTSVTELAKALADKALAQCKLKVDMEVYGSLKEHIELMRAKYHVTKLTYKQFNEYMGELEAKMCE